MIRDVCLFFVFFTTGALALSGNDWGLLFLPPGHMDLFMCVFVPLCMLRVPGARYAQQCA